MGPFSPSQTGLGADLAPLVAGSDVEEIFRKGEEGMKGAEGFIKQMEIGKTYTQVRICRPLVARCRSRAPCSFVPQYLAPQG